MLKNGAVSGIITRNYTVKNEIYDAYEITVFLKDPTTAPNNWPRVTYYSWDSNNTQLCGNWPGEVITDTRMVNGEKFYYKTFTITGTNYSINFVFNQGGSTASSHQTVDVTGVRTSSFFEVTTQTNKYQVRNVTDTYLPYLDNQLVMGDVNGDGSVDVSDVTSVIAYVLGATVDPFIWDAADMDGNGIIDISDVTAVIAVALSQN